MLLLEGEVFLGLNAPLMGFQGCIDPRTNKIFFVPQNSIRQKVSRGFFGFLAAFSQDVSLLQVYSFPPPKSIEIYWNGWDWGHMCFLGILEEYLQHSKNLIFQSKSPKNWEFERFSPTGSFWVDFSSVPYISKILEQIPPDVSICLHGVLGGLWGFKHFLSRCLDI